VTASEKTEFDYSDDALVLGTVLAFGFMSLASAAGGDLRTAALAPLTWLLLIGVTAINNAVARKRSDDVAEGELEEGRL
jgi:hypothetical protein